MNQFVRIGLGLVVATVVLFPVSFSSNTSNYYESSSVRVTNSAVRSVNAEINLRSFVDYYIVQPLSFQFSCLQLQSSCWAQEPSVSPKPETTNTPQTAAVSNSNSNEPTATEAIKPQTVSSEKKGKSTFWTIVNAGGTIGFVLFGLSIAALTIAIDVVRTLRRSVFMPEGLAADVRELLNRGQLLAADQRCRQTPCCLSYVINAGLAESDGDWPDIEKTLEDSMAEQSSRYVRKIETLSVIGNIAPMLGLLGTVVGMVYAFRLLAETQGTPRPSDLAEGIYLALVTTVEGLIVAIPSLAAFAWFRNRIDQLMTEVAFQTQHVFLPLKRQIRANKRPAAIQQPPRQNGK